MDPITIALMTAANLTLTRLHIELYLPAQCARMTTLTQYWVWNGGHAAVGLNSDGEPVTVFCHEGVADQVVMRTPLAAALNAYGLKHRVGELWEVARERNDPEFTDKVARFYSECGDEQRAVLADAIIERRWSMVRKLDEMRWAA